MSSEHEKHYTKVLKILLVAFAVSVVATLPVVVESLSIPQWLIQVIVFGVALVKAYFVAVHFMHISHEHAMVPIAVATPLILLVIFMGLLWPDFGIQATELSLIAK